MIELVDHAEGLLLPIRTQPGARTNGVLGEQAGALKLAVTAPPEDGRANAALVELVRDLFGHKRSQVEMNGGAKGRNKKVLIRGVTRDQLASWISELVVRPI